LIFSQSLATATRFFVPAGSAINGGGASPALQSLEAQRALLPYALAMFGISLPIYVWAASYAQDAVWMSATFAVFAINWGVFYAVVNWLRSDEAADLALRLRVQLMGGLLWAGTIAQMAAFADGAGPARESLLLLCVGASVVCLFFTAPSLAALLVVGPAAVAAPLLLLFSSPASRPAAMAAWGAVALAFALCLTLNQVLRRHFAMAAERETLIAERATGLARAESLAQSKSQIVATLSHEIRNGLTGVMHVLAAAAGQGGRAAPSREQLAAALHATNDLIVVLNATLDSETAEQGRLALAVEPLDPVRLVRELVLLNRPHAAAKGVEFTFFVEPALERRVAGAVIADASRTRQVLANLIGNAVKYTLRGRIEARVELRDDRTLAVEIADTGPGLTEEEMVRAFEPFQRVERTGAGVPGAGLGLSLSRQLAGLMGGRLTALSAMGAGSCFTLELPYDATIPVEPMSEVEGPSVMVSRGLKVLIAEDDALNAAMLRAILEQLGHQVVHAQNGRRAVDLTGVVDFDLIMLDGRMPLLDGAQTAAAIRAAGLKTPIIAVIGGEADEARECLAAGADAVLRKPVTVAGVARAVADAAAMVRDSEPRANEVRAAVA
jgi:signal transduction histidine kinase/AmiR/NasT family two-component response regulator